MKKTFMLIALLLSFLALFGTSRADEAARNEIPAVVRQVAANKDFFSRFAGYSSYKLHEAKRIDEGKIGLTLFDTAKITHTYIFDVKSVKVIYQDVEIMPKAVREDKFLRSIRVTDAVKIARTISQWGKEIMEKIAERLEEGAKAGPVKSVGNKKIPAEKPVPAKGMRPEATAVAIKSEVETDKWDSAAALEKLR